MGATARATKEIKKNRTEEIIEAIAQQTDFNSMAIGKLSIRAECMIQILLDKGIITKEEYEAEIKKAVEQLNAQQNGQEEIQVNEE